MSQFFLFSAKLSQLEERKEGRMSSLDGYSYFKSVSLQVPKQQMFPTLSTFKIYNLLYLSTLANWMNLHSAVNAQASASRIF